MDWTLPKHDGAYILAASVCGTMHCQLYQQVGLQNCSTAMMKPTSIDFRLDFTISSAVDLRLWLHGFSHGLAHCLDKSAPRE